jgi:hypothetical protein
MKQVVMVLFFLSLLPGCAGSTAHHAEHHVYGVQDREHALHLQAADREMIIETITQLFIATDQRNWERVTALFAPKVLFDMTSLAGGTPVTLTPRQIADAWDKGLKPLKAVHHQAGNHLVSVNGGQADAFCYGIASHYLPTKSGRNVRTFVGSYDFHLVKQDGVWWIDRFRFNLQYQDGNPDLEKDQ